LWAATAGSHGRGESDGLPPLLGALGAELPVLISGEAVAAGAEVVADGAEGLQEALGMRR
jgi:hypothetical protein